MATNILDIFESIDSLAARGNITRNKAFAAWYAINFFDINEDDALEAAAADGGNDQGIDLVFSDPNSSQHYVIQAYCPDNENSRNKATPKKKWDAISSSIPFITNPEILANSGRNDLAELITDTFQKNPEFSVTFGLISLAKHNTDIETSIKAAKKSDVYKKYDFFQESQETIVEKYNELIEEEGGIPEDSITFSGSYFKDSDEYGMAWVGTVSAKELMRLHSTYQLKLFAGNVRLYLGARKGGINEQIVKTAQESPGKFWALNNGITIVADSVTEKNDSSEDSTTEKITLKRFSIVNGCQTTSSLVKAGKTAENAKVLVRIIAAKTGIKNEITRYNNSQNAVKIWAVRATDEIQEQLKKQFATINIQYAPKQQGSRKKTDSSIIELDKVTQFLAATKQEFLIQAINNKAELFDEPYQKIYKRTIKPVEVYLAWRVGTMADEIRTQRVEELAKNNDENVNLLGVASSLWIIYCTYKLIDKFSDIQSNHISLEKMAAPEFTNALEKYINKSVDLFYELGVDTYDRDEYGSFKSTLRSVKFLQKIDSKVNLRASRLPARSLPDLANTAKSIKL